MDPMPDEPHPAADPAYRRDLGDGLVARWSTPDDMERVAVLFGRVWRRGADAPPNPRSIDQVRRQMRGDYPWTGPGDFALVEDTRRPDRPAVACATLWRHVWEFEGIPFAVGRPEDVATGHDYRRRGLIRALFDLLHARSAAEGHLVQTISGIPYFYRQFGYEYALDLFGARTVYPALIPPAPPGPEPVALRRAEEADVPRIMALYDRGRAESVVWAVEPEATWRALLAAMRDPTAVGRMTEVRMIVDAAGRTCGLAVLPTRRFGPAMDVFALEMEPGRDQRALLPALLRALAAYGAEIPDVSDSGPLREIGLQLGRQHPTYDALGPELAPVVVPPYAWYVRVPDLPRFLRHIAPALERRLAASPLAGHSGELRIDAYYPPRSGGGGGLRLAFAEGRLAAAEPWAPVPFGPEAHVGCPASLLLQLVFGYRDLDGLRATFPDVEVGDAGAAVLLRALFPARPSRVFDL